MMPEEPLKPPQHPGLGEDLCREADGRTLTGRSCC